jgi:hypothetical protein
VFNVECAVHPKLTTASAAATLGCGPFSSSLGLGPHCIKHCTAPRCTRELRPRILIIVAITVRSNSPPATMTAIYKPSEAIALLRPSFLLPRIQPCSSRRTHLGRTAFSTTRNAQATHSSTPNPPPGPQRKSITLTGDTGQVRWSDLSPGEKAVRTTQQSVNLVVVLVGILATVSS